VSFPILEFLRRRSSRLCPSKTDRLLRLLWRPQKELSWHLSTSLRTILDGTPAVFFRLRRSLNIGNCETEDISRSNKFHLWNNKYVDNFVGLGN
jgi:hypothetical protein